MLPFGVPAFGTPLGVPVGAPFAVIDGHGRVRAPGFFVDPFVAVGPPVIGPGVAVGGPGVYVAPGFVRTGFSCGGRCTGCCGRSDCMEGFHGVRSCDRCRPIDRTDYGCGGRAPRNCMDCCIAAGVWGSDKCRHTFHRSCSSHAVPAPAPDVVFVHSPAVVFMPATAPAPAPAPAPASAKPCHDSRCVGCCMKRGYTYARECMDCVHTMSSCSACRP